MTPLCLCLKEDWICPKCLKCGGHCECMGQRSELIHRMSREAALQKVKLLNPTRSGQDL